MRLREFYSGLIGLTLLFACTTAMAGQGRLLATGGLDTLEGAAGGGIVPWAVISGYGSAGQRGGTSFISSVGTGDVQLLATGAGIGIDNRVEVSLSQQQLDLGTLGTALGLPGYNIGMQTLAAKVRLAGNLVYSRVPQIALGVQYKRNLDGALVRSLGARHDSGFDLYLAASKLFVAGFFGRNLITNVTLRVTKANQIGLLGFGGDVSDHYRVLGEATLGIMLNTRTAIGVEYRQKPDNLGFAQEQSWRDFFIAWFPSKSITLSVAYVDLGSVATLPEQRGFYLSVEATF